MKKYVILGLLSVGMAFGQDVHDALQKIEVKEKNFKKDLATIHDVINKENDSVVTVRDYEEFIRRLNDVFETVNSQVGIKIVEEITDATYAQFVRNKICYRLQKDAHRLSREEKLALNVFRLIAARDAYKLEIKKITESMEQEKKNVEAVDNKQS